MPVGPRSNPFFLETEGFGERRRSCVVSLNPVYCDSSDVTLDINRLINVKGVEIEGIGPRPFAPDISLQIEQIRNMSQNTIVVDDVLWLGKTVRSLIHRGLEPRAWIAGIVRKDAKEELKNVLSGVPKNKRMNIIRFESVVTDWIKDDLGKEPKKLVPLQDKIRPRAIDFIDKAIPQGQTYMLAALKTVFGYEDLETLYLLSDGAPTPESGSMEEILRTVKRWNRLRNVKINTIGFYLRPKEKEFLRQLADENFGVFVDR